MGMSTVCQGQVFAHSGSETSQVGETLCFPAACTQQPYFELVLGSALHLSPVIFSTDMYKKDSVKGVERNRRGVGDKLILSGEKTKRPKDWKVFLANDENKTQFIQLLLSTWRSDVSADILTGHEIVLICEGKAYQLTSDGQNTFCEEIHSLESSQEETDSRVILYCMYATERGCKSV